MAQDSNDHSEPVEAIPEATELALQSVLQPAEQIIQVVEVVGCSLVVTDRHLIVVRAGAAHRPRSGVQLWPLDRTLTVHTTPVLHGTGRVVIEHGGRTTSVFVSSAQWAAAEVLVMETHRRIHGSDPG
jgi:hypothetical protein